MQSVTNLKFKDGEEEEGVFVASSISIEAVSNGWILKVSDEDEEETTEVYSFEQAPEMLTAIKEALGAPGA